MKTCLKSKMLFVLTICVALTSCETEELASSSELVTNESLEKSFLQEEAYPDISGEIVTIQLFGKSVQVEKIDDQYILDGDMIVIPDEKNTKSTGRTRARWPNNVVYYSIESSLPNQRRVTDAIAHWEANTDLTFVRRTNQSSYVYFRRGGGCSSSVGRVGGRQNINLANGCSTGNTIHEIGHAIGLWHEQSRKDRNQYITINFQNIQSNRTFNFQTYTQQGNDGDEYTGTLDFNSIMLYGSYAFSTNGQPTIVKKNGATYNAQRNGLSSGDIAGIKIMYPGDGGGGDICDGVAPWSSSQNYQPGDRVTYRGYLYERTNSGWTRIGQCGTSGRTSANNAPHLNDVDVIKGR